MSIPDKLLAVVRTQDITSKIPYSDLPYTAKAAFVVPAESTAMCAKARAWGTLTYRPYGHSQGDGKFEEVLLDNEPLTRLQLVGYTERAESGTCYKVITDHGWLVDFRSDEFMEAVFMGRIDGAGLIYGKYVWSQASGQMRLVLANKLNVKLSEKQERSLRVERGTWRSNRKVKVVAPTSELVQLLETWHQVLDVCEPLIRTPQKQIDAFGLNCKADLSGYRKVAKDIEVPDSTDGDDSEAAE